MIHHDAQKALVRMLFDPSFADTVARRPAESGLGPEVLKILGGVDLRSLRADPLRRRRTLGALCEELKASTTLAMVEARSLALLEGFFGAREFHASVEERTPMALAFGRYLLGLCEAGRLRTPQLRDVIRLELMQARARREMAPVEKREGAIPSTMKLRLAPGCVFGRLRADVLTSVQAAEKYLFELGLIPQLALADDGPRPVLPNASEAVETIAILVVPISSGLSMVTLDDELCAVIEPLDERRVMERAVLEEQVAKAVGSERAATLIDELIDDEVLAVA